MKSRWFIALFFVLTALSVGSVIGYNFYVDPYGLNEFHRERGFNYYKNQYKPFARTLKIYQSQKYNPEVIFLGTSRMEYLAPDLTVFENGPESFNFAQSGGTTTEMLHCARYAFDEFDVKELWYGLDFVSFTNLTPDLRDGFDTLKWQSWWPAWAEEAKIYSSWEMIEKGDKCIERNKKDTFGLTVKYQYNDRGSRTNNWRISMLNREGEDWLNKEYDEMLATYEALYNTDTLALRPNRMDAFAEVIEMTKANGARPVIFIAPLHHSQFKLIQSSRAYPLFQQWLRELAATTDFYYFLGDNKVTRDRDLFWDSQHPRREMAPVLNEYITGQSQPLADDFGMLVTEDNVEQLIEEIHQRWIETFYMPQ